MGSHSCSTRSLLFKDSPIRCRGEAAVSILRRKNVKMLVIYVEFLELIFVCFISISAHKHEVSAWTPAHIPFDFSSASQHPLPSLCYFAVQGLSSQRFITQLLYLIALNCIRVPN